MSNREEVEGLVRKIHQTLKRGESTQDHGLIGNLKCILDHVLPHIPYMDEIVAPRREAAGRAGSVDRLYQRQEIYPRHLRKPIP